MKGQKVDCDIVDSRRRIFSFRRCKISLPDLGWTRATKTILGKTCRKQRAMHALEAQCVPVVTCAPALEVGPFVGERTKTDESKGQSGNERRKVVSHPVRTRETGGGGGGVGQGVAGVVGKQPGKGGGPGLNIGG